VSKRIKLSKKQTLAWKYLEDNETTEIGYGGAAGGGKSWLGCIWHIYRRAAYPDSRGLIGRAELSALKESTLVTFFKACSDMGYRAGVDFKYNGQDHTVTWKNGSKTVFKDLKYYPSDPDFTSLGSTEYTDAFIDEATEITQKAFEIVNSRLRWKIAQFGLKPKTLITCNPAPGWVKERFILDKNAKPVILAPYQKFVQALPTDNPDEAFRQLYIEQLNKMTSDYDKRRLLYGDWEAEREVLNPFAHQYSTSKHESTLAKFDPNKQLLIKIDFNIVPFAVNFSHMWRDSEGEHFHTFAEAEIAKGSIPAMIDLLKAKFLNQLPNCIITGDAMGNRGDLSQRDNASYYMQLKRGLRLSDSQLRVKSNPTHDNSRADVNYVLANFPDYKINPETCPNTCRDMRTVQCDAFGEIIKRNRNDLTQRADYLDCFTGDTDITTINGQKPIKNIAIGDYVLTKNGYKKVIDHWSSTAEVYEFTFSNGEKIKCTKDHKFYAHNYGWCEILRIFTESKSVCKRSLNTTGFHITSTQNKNITIHQERVKDIQGRYIGRFGLIITEKFQKGIKFITKTIMLITTRLITLNWLNDQSIVNITERIEQRKTQLDLLHLQKSEESMRRNGIVQKRVKGGIVNMEKSVGLGSGITAFISAIAVKLNLKRQASGKGSVRICVNQNTEDYQGEIQLKQYAKIVDANLLHKNTTKEGFVLQNVGQHQTLTVVEAKKIGVQQVYDITVEDEHCFYANNILVHNCERYGINTFLRKWIDVHQKSGR
jgi:hypothetical protein